MSVTSSRGPGVGGVLRRALRQGRQDGLCAPGAPENARPELVGDPLTFVQNRLEYLGRH